jgi:hypothetical protein
MFDLAAGFLNQDEADALYEHIAGCPGCRREWSLCRSAAEALAGARASIPPPGDLRPAFYARLIASCRPTRACSRFKLLAAAPIVAAGLAGLVLLALHVRHPASTPQAPVTAYAPSHERAQERAGQVRTAGGATGERRIAQPRQRIALAEVRESAAPRLARSPGYPAHRVRARLESQRVHARHRMAQPAQHRMAREPERPQANEEPVQIADRQSPSSEGDVALAVCDEERGFVASYRASHSVNGVMQVDTKIAPAAALIAPRSN